MKYDQNIFGLTVPGHFWRQPDFILACFAAVVFWSVIHIASLQDFFPTASYQPQLAFYILLIGFPILEEIVFRGLIQESIHKLLLNNNFKTLLFSKLSYANVITSILFCLSHLWSQPVTLALAIFIPSIIFGYLKDNYGSLLPPVSLHLIYNIGFYLLV